MVLPPPADQEEALIDRVRTYVWALFVDALGHIL